LQELANSSDPIQRKLDVASAKSADIKKVSFDEKSFRFALNEDAMATEKTSEGIRTFAADIRKLEALIAAKRK
jgi:transaldolase